MLCLYVPIPILQKEYTVYNDDITQSSKYQLWYIVLLLLLSKNIASCYKMKLYSRQQDLIIIIIIIIQLCYSGFFSLLQNTCIVKLCHKDKILQLQ